MGRRVKGWKAGLEGLVELLIFVATKAELFVEGIAVILWSSTASAEVSSEEDTVLFLRSSSTCVGISSCKKETSSTRSGGFVNQLATLVEASDFLI